MEENININEDITICVDEKEINYTEEEEENRGGVDIVDMVATDSDLTFQRSRLELTERTPRVRSFPDLVDINLLFSDETFHETDAFTNDSISNESECNNISHIANDLDDDMDDKSGEHGDEPYDCLKFLMLLRAVNMQKKKKPDTSKNTNVTENEEDNIKNKTDSEEIPKNINNTNNKKDETTQTSGKLKFADVAKIQKHINDWTKKTRKLCMANVDPEDWGIELTDMAADSNSCSDETCTNFDRLKTMDMWQQISHYIKLKVRTTTIEVES